MLSEPSKCVFPNGRHKRRGPREIFGEMGLIDSRPRSATIVAVDYTICATYSQSCCSRTHPEEAVAFIRASIARLRDANEGH